MAKGPFKATEVFTGSKGMSPSKGALKSAQGKMSSAHGVVPKNSNTNMDKNTGGYRIGSGTRTFRSGLLPAAAPGHGAGHAGQPKGHKSKA